MFLQASAFLALTELDTDPGPKNPEDDLMAVLGPLLALVLVREDKSKIFRYVEEVVPDYLDDSFKRFFRMRRETFETVLPILRNTGLVDVTGVGRAAIPLEKQLLVFLWYIGSQDTVLQVADRFGITEYSVIEIRKRMSRALCRLRENFIRWPTGQERQDTIQNFTFPNTLGALDGTHIRIQAPHEDQDSYINRKGYHSLILQAVCRHDMVFTDCYAGWPGSVHDARVLRNSDLWENGLHLCRGGDCHIIADAAYPVRRWIMTPYRNLGRMTPQQRAYNRRISTARVVIERAFGLLKGRFRRMQYICVHDIQTAVKLIMSACVLFNICLLNADLIEDFYEADGGAGVRGNYIVAENNAEGQLKRDMISRNLN